MAPSKGLIMEMTQVESKQLARDPQEEKIAFVQALIISGIVHYLHRPKSSGAILAIFPGNKLVK